MSQIAPAIPRKCRFWALPSCPRWWVNSAISILSDRIEEFVNQVDLAELEPEYRAQLERVFDAGVQPTIWIAIEIPQNTHEEVA